MQAQFEIYFTFLLKYKNFPIVRTPNTIEKKYNPTVLSNCGSQVCI